MLFRVALICLSSLLAHTFCSEWSSRIMGGSEVHDIRRHPWMLSLQRWDSHRCGASIIGKRWALTAAHCLVGVSAPAEVTVRAGTTSRELGGWLIGVDSFHPHPEANLWMNDIALLHVQRDFPFGSKVQAVKLESYPITATTTASVTGWSRTGVDKDVSSMLQGTTVVVTIRNTCTSEYGFDITPDILCARPKRSGTDICEGVAGGPLTTDGTQYGIAVYGRCLGDTNKNSLYVDVSYFYDWIQKVMALSPNDDYELI